MEKTVENHFNITVSGKQILDKRPGETETIYTQGWLGEWRQQKQIWHKETVETKLNILKST